MENRRAVGIDLGTTFSAIAIVEEGGQARPIPNAEGSTTTPSVALWRENAFLVGQPALDLVRQARGVERDRLAASLVRGVKRMMGNPPEGGLTSNERTTTPVEVSAAILAKLARDATARLGFPVRDAVITVPAHFGDRERSATKLAAEMAGLNVLRMINEPSAAALAYTRGDAPAPGVALVFDLGGGTFDATVLELGRGPLTVLATQGIEELGGLNFTNNLATALRRRYETEMRATYPTDSIAMDVLVMAAEVAKCALSDAMAAMVHLEPPDASAHEMEVTRAEFERQIKLYLLQLKTAVEIAVERAKKHPAEVDRVLLCGGSSRIPAVQEMLEQIFGKPPERTLDLDLSVALGAAYLAAQTERPMEGGTSLTTPSMHEIKPGILQDCIGNPVGIAMLDATGSRIVKVVLLHQGDALDTWSMPYRVRIATTGSDFPPVQVYQGENLDIDSRDFVGDITLNLPAGTPAGAHATVEMKQDQSGLVQVRLTVDGADLPGGLRRA